MNYTFLPDLSALTILIVILLLMRRRHSDARADAWLLGLFFTLIEALAHTFYPTNAMPAKVLHVIVVDCYAMAGLVFLWASSDQSLSRKSRLLFLSLNGLPLVILTTLYGLNLRVSFPYFPAIVAGFVLGVGSSLLLRRSWPFATVYALGWTVIAGLVTHGFFRNAVYWSLACVYATAALNFKQRLAPKSTGRLAIVTGFTIWALCFLLHPWIVNYASLSDIVSHVWTMQKSLISIGMILVMLEEQAASNEFLALHDELTGLPNRRMFTSRLNQAIQHSERNESSLALVVLDLDGFKKINDTLGHLAGDHVLREISSTLRKNVRSSDTVARLGGDEFIIVAANMTGETSVQSFAECIRSAIERPILINGQVVMVTASLGVAIYPLDARDATKLLRTADHRMYQIKNKLVEPEQIEAAMSMGVPNLE